MIARYSNSYSLIPGENYGQSCLASAVSVVEPGRRYSRTWTPWLLSLPPKSVLSTSSLMNCWMGIEYDFLGFRWIDNWAGRRYHCRGHLHWCDFNSLWWSPMTDINVVQLLSSFIWPLLLVAFLRETETAVTW